MLLSACQAKHIRPPQMRLHVLESLHYAGTNRMLLFIQTCRSYIIHITLVQICPNKYIHLKTGKGSAVSGAKFRSAKRGPGYNRWLRFHQHPMSGTSCEHHKHEKNCKIVNHRTSSQWSTEKNDQTYKYSLDPVRYSDNVLEGKEFPKTMDFLLKFWHSSIHKLQVPHLKEIREVSGLAVSWELGTSNKKPTGSRAKQNQWMTLHVKYWLVNRDPYSDHIIIPIYSWVV